MTTIFRHLIIAALCLPSAAGAEPRYQDLEALDLQVAAAAGDAGLVARPIDRRLRLAACPVPIEVAGPIARSMTVRCPALGWRIRVPIDGATPEALTQPVIRRGDPVTVEFQANGFALSAQGVAEDDAQAGGRVRVRIDPKIAPLTGEAVSEGVVRFRR